jgi:hypothetical protein
MPSLVLGLEWPGQWDQSAWGTAAGVLSLLVAAAAAVQATGAKRAGRAQRRQIGQYRLATALASMEGEAEAVLTATMKQVFVLRAQRWAPLIGGILALADDAEYGIDPSEARDLRDALSIVAAKIDLSVQAVEDGASVKSATVELRKDLPSLRERCAGLQLQIEQGRNR